MGDELEAALEQTESELDTIRGQYETLLDRRASEEREDERILARLR